jgi:hypothetical protein
MSSAAVNISPLWHGINNLKSMRIPDELEHQFRALNHGLLPIRDLISIWQPDHLMIYRQGESWLVKGQCAIRISILDAGWTTGDREV